MKRLLILGAVAASLAVAGATQSARPPALLTYSVAAPTGTSLGICIARPDGTQRVRLTRGVDSRPSWSPGGRFVVFQRQTAPGSFELVVADTRGRVVRRFGSPYATDPAWSRDGRYIAYSAATRIIVATAAGRTVTEFRGSQVASPTWSRDGKLAFAEARHINGPDQTIRWVTVLNVDGTGRRTMLSGAGDPAWSPDGSKIAYVAYPSRLADTGFVTVANADGTGAHRLTAGSQPEWRPAWSPTGRLIAFARGEVPKTSVVTMPSAGGPERLVLRAAANGAADPAWRPHAVLPRARRAACR